MSNSPSTSPTLDFFRDVSPVSQTGTCSPAGSGVSPLEAPEKSVRPPLQTSEHFKTLTEWIESKDRLLFKPISGRFAPFLKKPSFTENDIREGGAYVLEKAKEAFQEYNNYANIARDLYPSIKVKSFSDMSKEEDVSSDIIQEYPWDEEKDFTRDPDGHEAHHVCQMISTCAWMVHKVKNESVALSKQIDSAEAAK